MYQLKFWNIFKNSRSYLIKSSTRPMRGFYFSSWTCVFWCQSKVKMKLNFLYFVCVLKKIRKICPVVSSRALTNGALCFKVLCTDFLARLSSITQVSANFMAHVGGQSLDSNTDRWHWFLFCFVLFCFVLFCFLFYCQWFDSFQKNVIDPSEGVGTVFLVCLWVNFR